MMTIIENNECTGCHACYSVCPKQAITMVKDDKGFKVYKIDEEKCIKCGLCKKVCPVLNSRIIESKPEAFAIINKDEEIRKHSSSGGVFSLIAEHIIKDGGVVFGAAFDENWHVKHSYTDKVEELNRFRGSKYLQSTIGDSYKKAKEFLENGRKVLFTGTPCQIEGLKTYLQKEYNNLYTQDIICHGVPSPKVHDKYLEYQKNKQNIDKIKDIKQRFKNNGWQNFSTKIEFDSSTYIESHNKDPFMQAFLRDTILRDSCYNCHFKKKNRNSDITLADFWGINNVLPEMNDDKGTSLVIIHSMKGKELLENIRNKIICKKVDFETAIKYNPSMTKSAKKDIKREEFFRNIDNIRFDKLVNKYTSSPGLFKKILSKSKRMIKKIVNYHK